MLFRLKLYVTWDDTHTKRRRKKRRHRKSVVKKTNDSGERVEYERNNYNAFSFDTLNQTVRCSQTAHNYMLVARSPILQPLLLLLLHWSTQFNRGRWQKMQCVYVHRLCGNNKWTTVMCVCVAVLCHCHLKITAWLRNVCLLPRLP